MWAGSEPAPMGEEVQPPVLRMSMASPDPLNCRRMLKFTESVAPLRLETCLWGIFMANGTTKMTHQAFPPCFRSSHADGFETKLPEGVLVDGGFISEGDTWRLGGRLGPYRGFTPIWSKIRGTRKGQESRSEQLEGLKFDNVFSSGFGTMQKKYSWLWDISRRQVWAWWQSRLTTWTFHTDLSAIHVFCNKFDLTIGV